MKAFFKVVIWIAVIVAGLVGWNVAPDFRPLVASILAAAFVCYVLSVIVAVTVKRVISDEQLELRNRLEGDPSPGCSVARSGGLTDGSRP